MALWDTRELVRSGTALLLCARLCSGASPAESAISAAVNEFCCAVYRQVSERDGNVAISPVGLTAALAMAYAGAEGETAAEMAGALSWGTDRENGLDALAQLMRNQNKSLHRNGGVWKSINRVWIQQDFAVRDAYRDRVEKQLAASLGLCDFVGRPDETRQSINQWVRSGTAGLIPELLGPGTVSSLTRMALINATYFKAPWAAGFPAGNTRE